SSTWPTSMPRSAGRPAARPRVTVSSRFARSGRRPRALHEPDRMSAREGDSDARSTADAVARRSYGKLVAFLAARTRDMAAAEDALSEAFASALTSWPKTGCPASPEAWLLTVARRKMIDIARRRRSGEIAAAQLQVL